MSTALTSMAIIKVNFDRAHKDVLDNFIPFMADRVYHLSPEAISIPELREAIREEYGISIPAGVLKILTKRCVKGGLFKQESGILYPVREKVAAHDLSSARAAVRREHAAIVRLGSEYAHRKFDLEMSTDEFDVALNSFIRENAAPLLATVVDGRPLVDFGSGGDVDRTRYPVASFIAELSDSEPQAFEYFSAVVKGVLLASALYFSDITFSTRLDRLAIYVDTTLLLRALGMSGPDLQLLAGEVIALALKLGARVYCFKHTLEETQGILDATEAAVRTGGRFSYGETVEYALSAGYGASDILEVKTQLESRLEGIGVRVREKPSHDVPLTLNENRLEEVLNDEIHYHNRVALHKDIDSLTSIFRLRGGNEYRQLERAKAVFVTHNTALARASRKYMKLEEWERETIPLCIPEFVLTTLLWLKEPLAAPALPTHSIIADCLAAMKPSDQLWRQYLEKIEDLRTRGTVTDDEYVLLRQSMPLRSLIMFETNENPEAFTEGTVDRVLKKARENIAGAALAEAAEAKQRRTEADVQLELAREETRRLRLERDATALQGQRHLESIAHKWARKITLVLTLLTSAIALVGFIFMTPWPGMKAFSVTGITVALVFLAVLVAAALTLYGLLVGGNVRILANKIENWITRQILRRLTPGS